MLCKFCRTLDFDAACSKEGAAHYANWSDLCTSAGAGCELCSRICAPGSDAGDLTILGDHDRHDSRDIRCFYDNNNSWLFWAGRPYEVQKVIKAIHVCSAGDDPMSKLLQSRYPSSDATSESAFSQMQVWLDTCLTNHVFCRSESGRERSVGPHTQRDCLDAKLPTRVIDVGGEGIPPSLFISQGKPGQWVAISHRWGEQPTLRLDSQFLPAFITEIPFHAMPLMFQDAVVITRRLGFRYLWIDCLCILQDDEEDWLRESLMMGDIYQNAIVTIAAEAAENSSVGILSNTGRGGTQKVVRIRAHSSSRSTEGELLLLRNGGFQSASLSAGPLSTRKWVLQEEFLSTRILRFTAGQIWWQCHELQCNESFPLGRKVLANASTDNVYIRQRIEWTGNRPFPSRSERKTKNGGTEPARRARRNQTMRCWYWTVNKFCRRFVTYDSDTLPAFSGVAKEFQRQVQNEGGSYGYKAGMWLNDLPFGLRWYTTEPGALKTSCYVAPSWSWASLKFGPVYNTRIISDLAFQGILWEQSAHKIATVVDLSITSRTEDPFGQVQEGFIELRGPCQEVCRCCIPSTFFDCFEADDTLILNYSAIQQLFHKTGNHPGLQEICTVDGLVRQGCSMEESMAHSPCVFLHIASTRRLDEGRVFAFALILEKIRDAKEIFRRIGLATLLDNGMTPEIWPTNTVVII